jgi:hypothetical protein
MRIRRTRWFRTWVALSHGALMPGILQALGMVDFNNILFQFLATILSTLVAVLLGGDLGDVQAGLGGTLGA